MKFVIIRHGETQGNAQNLIQGAGVDLPLNDTGRKQATEVAEKLNQLNLPVIYCSKMIRAKQTAQIIADKIKCPFKPFDNLEEVHYGDAEGMLSSEAKKLYKDVFEVILDRNNPKAMEVSIPNGESIGQSTQRGIRALMSIKESCDYPIVGVVSHGSLMFNIYYHFFKKTHRFENCEFFEVEL